jgi:hypothetical protein
MRLRSLAVCLVVVLANCAHSSMVLLHVRP